MVKATATQAVSGFFGGSTRRGGSAIVAPSRARERPQTTTEVVPSIVHVLKRSEHKDAAIRVVRGVLGPTTRLPCPRAVIRHSHARDEQGEGSKLPIKVRVQLAVVLVAARLGKALGRVGRTSDGQMASCKAVWTGRRQATPRGFSPSSAGKGVLARWPGLGAVLRYSAVTLLEGVPARVGVSDSSGVKD